MEMYVEKMFLEPFVFPQGKENRKVLKSHVALHWEAAVQAS